MDIVFDPLNKPTQEYYFFSKFKMAAFGQTQRFKIDQIRPYQITFWLGVWSLFVRFGQILAWIYYLTLETSLQKNFSFFSQSKMAAGGQNFLLKDHGSAWQMDPIHLI